MSGPGTTKARATAETAQDEGREFAHSTKESSAQVAQTVKQEATNVAGEVKSQAQSLAGEARSQVSGKVEAQKSKAASTLRTTADELHSLTSDQDHSRLTSELTRRAATQAHSVADYLDNKGAEDILDDLRTFARRKPGVFLLAAGLAGVAVGRLVKGAMSGGDNSSSPRHAMTDETYVGTTYTDPSFTGTGTAYPPADPYSSAYTGVSATVPPTTTQPYPGTTPEYGREPGRGGL